MHNDTHCFAQGQEPIAIIGYSYRLPGVAEDKDELVWDLFLNRRSVRVDIVEEAKRYDKGQVPWDGQPNPFKHASQWEGAFINSKELTFDPQFFHTNTNDASSMDVQHKLGLLTAAEALENAGIDFSTLCGTDTGVFAGGQASGAATFHPTFGGDEYSATGTAQAMMANRISFFFNLTGPSVTYDTACSGLMTALHGAQASLHARECKLGILVAAVVHYGFAHNPNFTQLGVLSPDGRCRSFDDAANGYIPADGVFCYILKRLSDAERDNDKIYGVIRGVHVSSAGPGEGHVGLTSGRSLTTPTVEGQRLAIEGACSRAGIDVDSINYIECHATGTKVGDYMEASALGQVFGTQSRKTPLLLSSCRSNFGHMEAASAGLSILKVLLMFQHRTFLPLSENFSTPNSTIPFEELKLQPLSTCEPFPKEKVVIGINSFGFGGANGHAVIEEYVPNKPTLYSQPSKVDPLKYYTFVISAKSSKALYNTATNLAGAIRTLQKDTLNEQDILYHLAGNLATRRTQYAVRKYFTANSLSQLTDLLEDFAAQSGATSRKEINAISEHTQHRVCFVFPGQGSQWAGCGVSLYQTEPIFRSVVDTIDAYFLELSGKSLKEIMFSSKPESETGVEKADFLSELDRCDVAQPLNFMIQVGLVEMCRNVGVHPTCMVGHSAGELAAAYASNAIPLKEMVRLAYERARLQQQLSGAGRMLVVPLSPQEIQQETEQNPQLFHEIEVSCYNTPNVTVVSGPESVCETLSNHLKETRGLQCQFIRGSIPFHSSKMEKIKEDILHSLSFLDEINSTPQIPVVSTVKAIVEGSFDKYYWWLNTRTAVKFEQAISYVVKHFRPTIFVELSPHITLRSNVRDIYTHLGVSPAVYVPTLIRNENDSKMWANTLGAIFEKGYGLEWKALYPNPIHIKLPNYPFDYKMVSNMLLDESYTRRHGPFGAGPLLGHAIWTHEKTYEVVLSSRHFPFLAEHVAQNVPLMPAAGYIEMVLQAFGGEPVTLKNIQISAACPIIPAIRLLQLKLSSAEGPFDPIEFKISSTTSRYDSSVPWIVHCSGVVQRTPPEDAKDQQQNGESASQPESLTKLYDEKEFYQRIPDDAFAYGTGFKVIKEFSQDKNDPKRCWSFIQMDEKHFEATQKAGWFLHPYMLDGVIQSYLGLCFGRAGVPYCIDEFQFLRSPTSSSVRAEIIYPPNWDGALPPGIASCGDAKLYNEDGSMICIVRNNTVMVPPLAEGVNATQGWQTKSINLPEAKLLATEITENPGDIESDELSQNLIDQFRQAVLSFLGLEDTVDCETASKKINAQPSPAKEYIQFLWEKCQQKPEPNTSSSPLLLEFAQKLSESLRSYTASTPITPQWVFTPFVQPLKHIIDAVISDSSRVVRILEVSNSCNFSVLPQLQDVAISSLEYFFASSSYEILTAVTEQAQFDFPVRSLQADFEQTIPSEVMPYDGFFDLVIANMPTGLDSQEKCESFLANYQRKITPGGLLVLTGFEKVNTWLTCVGVDSKMIVPHSVIKNCGSQFNVYHTVPTKLDQAFPHTIHVLKPHFSIPSYPIQTTPTQNSNPPQNGISSTNGNSPQNNIPTQNLVFADSSGFYETISHSLASPVCIPHNSDQSFDITQWLTSGESLNILFLWCLQDKTEFCITTFNALAELTRAIIQSKNLGKVNVWVVTQNTVRETSNMHGGTMWGLVRTIGQELKDLRNVRFHMVDIGTKEDMKALTSLMASNFCENECMIRNNELFVSRLFPLRPEAKDADTNDKIIYLNPEKEQSVPFRLQIGRNAQLSSLAFHTYTVPEVPGPDQVIIRVHYTALNFRDLMVALDRLPHHSYETSYLGKNLGIECSGIVTAVGSNVNWLVPGDKVMCMAGACIANIIAVDHDKVLKVPENINMAQASSVLSVYLAAYYSLIHMAKLSRGMSCLIHSGMGGVGLAAIAIAKHYGFDIYATAGTPEKRAKLLEMGCKGAYDSHSLRWAAQLLSDTNGRGVDAVLNSLHGAHIELGLKVLAFGGWFCEIGKRDIYANSKIGMYALRKSITITAVDNDSLLKLYPDRARNMCALLKDLIAEEKLVPIPIEEYPVCDYMTALRQMQQGKHTGKLVLNLRDATSVPVVDHRPLFSPEGTYLVTGGLGGFGLRLLPYLYKNGVRNLLLTDSDASRHRSVEFVREATRMGTDIRIAIDYADVSKYDDVEKVVKKCKSELPPIKGVFHLAGVADGGSIMAQNAALYQKSLGAKAHGALNLHRATQQHSPPLTHFVMISSAASVLGSTGQANYAAANAFLDSLARHRRASGLCGTSFNMGGISDVGMAAKDFHARKALRIKGINLFPSASALAGLDYQLRNNISEMISANLNLDLKLSHPYGYCTVGLLSKNNLSEAVNMSHNAVLNLICKQVQKLTGASDVPPSQPLSSFGVDSMMATELSIWIKDKFNVQVSAIRLMSAESCETTTQKILSNHESSSSSSSSASSSSLLSPPSQEENSLLGVGTEFVENKKIGTNFPETFTKIHHTSSPVTLSTTAQNVKTDAPDSAVLPNVEPTLLADKPKLKKESEPSPSKDALNKDSTEQVTQDIEDIFNSFTEYMQKIGPPSAVHEFQNIILTGATGFVGRVFLAHIIKYHPNIKVTCIVRAENNTIAMERIKAAIEEAGYWRDSFLNNIIAMPGDLSQERLGLSEEDYNKLCITQHAVFHFAANISLVEPYSSIRHDNTLVMMQVLRFCATSTAKPLHHMSTLAVYPEYNAGFPPAWSEKILMEDEPSNLERFASPKELGYPWSKWACEQVALRCCKSADIPLIIYRIPLTSLDSDTGFMSDVSMLVAIAALQEGILPSFSFLINYTALDVICEIVANLALNTQRKHCIYNVVSKEAHHLTTMWKWMNEIGFEVKYIADEQVFIDTGAKPGSPLKRILPTLELMRNAHQLYGRRSLDDPMIKNGLPISTKNVEEDYKKVKWPRAELGYVSAFLWMLKQGDKWQYPIPKIKLQLESVMQHVQSFTGLTTMGPNSFYEPLAHLFDALNTEAHLSDIGRLAIRQDIWRRLLNRQHLFKTIRASPEISQIQIKRPIFILGLPGSGSAYLHRLLAEDPRFRAPYFFELHCPVRNTNEIEDIPADKKEVDSETDFSSAPDSRLRKAYTEWQARKIHTESVGLQLEEVNAPAGDYVIMQHDIQCLSWTVPCDIPSFRSWLLAKADMRGSYAFHKLFLQFLQHEGRNFLSPGENNEYSWVLEFPMHMMFIQYIFETYPDARVIQTHRPPAEAISWWCGMVETMRKVYSDKIEKKEIGQSQLKAMQEMLESVQTFRTSHPELADRFIDVTYHDLLDAPVNSVDKLYTQLFADHNTGEVKKYLKARPALIAKLQSRLASLEKESKMALNLGEFGLSKEQVEDSFAKYIQQYNL